jgi:phosphonate transport system substrate-binding protein
MHQPKQVILVEKGSGQEILPSSLHRPAAQPKEEVTCRIIRSHHYFLLFLLVSALMTGCLGSGSKPRVVDFSDYGNDSLLNSNHPDADVLEVAVSSMISPKETFMYYEELFEYLSVRLNRRIRLSHRLSYQEVNDMLVANEVDLAFICTGAYIRNSDDFDLLAVPVCYGKPYYQAYVIVNEETGITRFEQLNGRTFAYTDPLSNTGKMYALKRLQELGVAQEMFFGKTFYSGAHDMSIQLVAKNIVDGATIDGLIYEYMLKYSPEKVRGIRVIEKSEYYGMPPVVTSRRMSPEFRQELTEIFTNMHKDPAAKQILNKILIDRFIYVTDTLYSRAYEIAASL